MRIEHTTEFFSRASVSADHYRVYIFGDNLQETGNGGQACIRGLPNAYGVPTKKYPSYRAKAFFSDDYYEDNCTAIDTALAKIPANKPWVVNVNIGRGRAQLHKKAPRTYAYLCQKLGILKKD